MRAAAVLALLVALAGCPVHMQRNAPGTIDVHAPPSEIAREQVEPPIDPGERVFMVSAGALAGVGVRVGGDGRLAAEGAAEISVSWGELDKSHEKAQPIVPIPIVVLPPKRTGINLGWVFAEPNPDNSDDGELGPIYLEYQVSRLLSGWSAGYSWDPEDDSHGPHVGAFFTGYYVKAGYRIGRGAEAMIGVVLKLPQTFVWSR